MEEQQLQGADMLLINTCSKQKVVEGQGFLYEFSLRAKGKEVQTSFKTGFRSVSNRVSDQNQLVESGCDACMTWRGQTAYLFQKNGSDVFANGSAMLRLRIWSLIC